MPTRHIQPGTAWALGHNDDRTAYIGPVHTRCNASDGATRGNQRRSRHRRTNPTWHSRQW